MPKNGMVPLLIITAVAIIVAALFFQQEWRKGKRSKSSTKTQEVVADRDLGTTRTGKTPDRLETKTRAAVTDETAASPKKKSVSQPANSSVSTPPKHEQSVAELPREPQQKRDSSTTPTDSSDSGVDLGEMLKRSVKLGQDLSKAADDIGQKAVGLSLKEEIELGRIINKDVCQKNKTTSSPATKKRLNDLAKPMLKQVQRDGIKYTFTVLASPEFNAFSHLGGYIYVSQGLLEFVDSDAELQFILGHEIAHVDLGHCRRGMTYAVRAGERTGNVGATIIQQAYQLISLGYSEDQEFESDEWSYRNMIKIGRSREEALSLTRHFARHFPDEKRSNTGAAATDVLVGEIEKHLSSHPPSSERQRRLELLDDTSR